MARYRINLLDTFAPYGDFTEDALRGGLGGGYFYTTVDATQKIRLWSTADLSAPVDTINVGSSRVSNTQDWSAWNVTPAGSTLRQRQSPRRSPSRVGWY